MTPSSDYAERLIRNRERKTTDEKTKEEILGEKVGFRLRKLNSRDCLKVTQDVYSMSEIGKR